MDRARQVGFTLLEVLVVVSVLGILLGIMVTNIRKLDNPVRNTAQLVNGAVLRIRAEAMQNTQARRLILTNSKQLMEQSGLDCASSDPTAWTNVKVVNLSTVNPNETVPIQVDVPALPVGQPADPSLPPGAKLAACFTPRGLAYIPKGLTTGEIRIYRNNKGFKNLIALGGGTKIEAYTP